MSTWQAIPQPDGTWLVKEPSQHIQMGAVIGTKGGRIVAARVADENDARLIVAAPELLAACQAVETALLPYRDADASPERTYLVGREQIKSLRAAIAKATGQ